jgi:hypothetical protein
MVIKSQVSGVSVQVSGTGRCLVFVFSIRPGRISVRSILKPDT